jgi:hypothetical protein
MRLIPAVRLSLLVLTSLFVVSPLPHLSGRVFLGDRSLRGAMYSCNIATAL